MIIVNGNVSKAAETKMVTTRKGTKTMVTEFSVANNIGFGENEEVQFFKVSIWHDRGAKLAPYLTKGRPVYIVGEVKASAYISKETGAAVPVLEIVRVSELKLIGKKTVAGEPEVFDGEDAED